jgi:mono/diheme cytochrome c family protein
MPDMSQSYAFKAQEELLDKNGNATGKSVMRMPVKGTVPRGFDPYTIKDLEEAKSLENPVKMTKESLTLGRTAYNINCFPCHGKFGDGDGPVIKLATYNQRMPQPPSIHSNKVSKWTDGQIFHVMAVGQGNMPSYASRMDKNTRWAVVHYVRAIQAARNGDIKVD